MPGMAHWNPGATAEWEKEGAEESSCLTVIILSKAEGVLALQPFHCSKLEPSHSPPCGGGGWGGSDTHTIPSDKLRPVGNKVAAVGTEQRSEAWWPHAVHKHTPEIHLACCVSDFIPPTPTPGPGLQWITISVSQGVIRTYQSSALLFIISTIWHQHPAGEGESLAAGV